MAFIEQDVYKRQQQRVAQADLRDADLLQRGDGRNTRLVHLRKPHDKCLKRGGGVAVPQLSLIHI